MTPQSPRWVVRDNGKHILHDLRGIPLGHEETVKCCKPNLGVMTFPGKREEDLRVRRNDVSGALRGVELW
jgi:hypothetical protein